MAGYHDDANKLFKEKELELTNRKVSQEIMDRYHMAIAESCRLRNDINGMEK